MSIKVEAMNERSLIELATVDLDLACLKEQNNRIAISQGLPPIGATLTNAHGIEWIVDGHTYAPSVMTLGRTETEDRLLLLGATNGPDG